MPLREGASQPQWCQDVLMSIIRSLLLREKKKEEGSEIAAALQASQSSRAI